MGFLRGAGPLEVFLILMVVLIVFGVGKLPSTGRRMGQAIREFRTSVKEPTDKPTEIQNTAASRDEEKAQAASSESTTLLACLSFA